MPARTSPQPSQGAAPAGRTLQQAMMGLLLVLATATFLYTIYKMSTIRAISCSGNHSLRVFLDGHNLSSTGHSSLTGTKQKKKFAYAFYAAADPYHCSCLVNTKRLIDLGKDKDIDVVILMPDMYQAPKQELLAQGEKLGIRYKHVPNLDLGTFTNSATAGFSSYYRGAMSKLHAFNLTEYDRVMFFDSDELVLKSPEELFEKVPEALIAAPRSYWLLPGQFPQGYHSAHWAPANGPEVGPQMKFGSYFMLIQPSEYIWGRVYGKYYKDGKPTYQDLYDMDLINIEFKDDVVLLPGNLAISSTDYLKAHADPRPSDLHHIPLEDWWHSAYILHFFAPGKVWSWNPKQFNASHPQAHALLKEAWQTWWDVHALVCAEGVAGVVHV